MITLAFLIVLLVLAISGYILIYNKLIVARQKVHEAWSDVDVQLKRRHDLIPNLVNVVKGYAKHEKDLLEKVTKERTEALETNKNDMKKLGSIEAAIANDLGAILMVAEAYPDLKANETFLKLQNELSETEDQIASARRIYNANVNAYNTLIQIFPLNIAANIGGFEESSFLDFKESKAVPSITIN